MRHLAIALCIGLSLTRIVTAQAPGQANVPQTSEGGVVMTNADVIKLVQAGLGDAAIIRHGDICDPCA